MFQATRHWRLQKEQQLECFGLWLKISPKVLLSVGQRAREVKKMYKELPRPSIRNCPCSQRCLCASLTAFRWLFDYKNNNVDFKS